MEISPSTAAGQAIAINRAEAGQEVLQKTVEKTDESRQEGKSPERPETERVSGTAPGRVDIYI